jgi:tryptophan 2,3-dioxygenase
MQISPEIEQRLAQLQQKYEAMGQDMSSYLDGLLYADFFSL